MKKNRFLKVVFTVCIICFLVLVSVPVVNSGRVWYLKEDGPYFVYISGKNWGTMSGYKDFINHSLPFWYLIYPDYIAYQYEIFSILIVNGTLQNIKNVSFPASITLFGFKGFAPTMGMIVLKALIGRVRVVGMCDEILVVN
jgi:hypothetical protein